LADKEDMRMTIRTPVLCAAVLLATTTVWAQTTVTKPGQTTKRSATIQSIDATDRVITLKTDDGTETRMWAPPSTITRFDELKVGDRVNVTYYASTVYQVRKPGDAPVATAGTAASTTPAPSPLPGGTVARQTTSSVTVKSIDPAIPSVTVTTADGRTVTHMIADKANLAGVQVGDRIDITYTEAALVSVERGQ
jgi:Cu/Ag efflux protein CusF